MNSLILRLPDCLCAGGECRGSAEPIPDENVFGHVFPQGASPSNQDLLNCFSVVPSFTSFSVLFCQLATGRTELQATAHNLKWVCVPYKTPLGRQNIFYCVHRVR